MSTITSPRASAPSTSLNSSPTTSRTSSPAPTTTRRTNRSALRDYYNLKPSSPTDVSTGAHTPSSNVENAAKASPLDEEGFDADGYIKSVLANQSLEGVLKVEAGLINEIKGLDGERKALVYDNYSKLITATDTIRKMRTNMDPLTPTTGTLGMAVGYIAETAAGLAVAGRKNGDDRREVDEEEENKVQKKKRQRETVRWVVETPMRLRNMLEKGEKEEAERDWDMVKKILEQWKEVQGVDELREECKRIMDRT